MLRYILAAAFLLPATSVLAQDIVVTGRGLQAAASETIFHPIEIDRDRLTGSASNRLEDILRDVPGFQMFRRSDSRTANPTSQGVTLRSLGGNASSRALLILDGVPQTDPFGGWISWPAYDPQRLGQVRVTRGGGSGVNGPGALAGTIELESASPADLRGANAMIAYGSRDSVDAHAGVGANLGAGFVTLSAAFSRGDGFIPVVEEQRGPVDRPSPYRQASTALRVVAPLTGDIEIQAMGLVFSDARERGTDFSDIKTSGADASLRLVGRRWSALAYVQTRDFYNSFASVGAGRASVSQASEQYSVPSTGLGGRFELRPELGAQIELRLGADWRDTIGTTRELYTPVAGNFTRARVAGGRSRNLGSFAEATWSQNALTVTGAARLDYWRLSNGRLHERTLASGAAITDSIFPSRSGVEPTGRAGISWQASKSLSVRSAVYLGWRLPTLNELYRPFRAGTDATAANAALDPERLKGVEAGAEWRKGKARIGLTLFANRLEDGIANVTLGSGPGSFPGVGFVGAGGEYRQRQNIDAIVARGAEIDAHLDLGRWELSAGGSVVDAEVRSSGPALALNGKRPAQTPRYSLSSTLAWEGPRATRASLSARYIGGQFEDDLNNQYLPSALTFDAAASISLMPRLALDLRAENLTDKRVLAGISGNGIAERATPRTLWLGLRLLR